MRIIFGSNNHWVSKLIRLLTWGEFSHVAVVIGDRVVESVGIPPFEWVMHCLFKKPYKKKYGVQVNSLKGFKKRYPHNEMRCICGDEKIALSRVGRGFDMIGLVGYLLKREWQDPELDFCTETVIYSATFISNCIAHKVSPSTLYWFSYPIELEYIVKLQELKARCARQWAILL